MQRVERLRAEVEKASPRDGRWISELDAHATVGGHVCLPVEWLAALLDIAEASGELDPVCDQVPEYSEFGPGETPPRCGECVPCRLRAALSRLDTEGGT